MPSHTSATDDATGPKRLASGANAKTDAAAMTKASFFISEARCSIEVGDVLRGGGLRDRPPFGALRAERREAFLLDRILFHLRCQRGRDSGRSRGERCSERGFVLRGEPCRGGDVAAYVSVRGFELALRRDHARHA